MPMLLLAIVFWSSSFTFASSADDDDPTAVMIDEELGISHLRKVMEETIREKTGYSGLFGVAVDSMLDEGTPAEKTPFRLMVGKGEMVGVFSKEARLLLRVNPPESLDKDMADYFLLWSKTREAPPGDLRRRLIAWIDTVMEKTVMEVLSRLEEWKAKVNVTAAPGGFRPRSEEL